MSQLYPDPASKVRSTLPFLTANDPYGRKETKKMESFLSTSISVTLSQIGLALIFCTIPLMFSRVRLALFAAYCFVFYWAKPWNLPLFTDTTPSRINTPECLFIAFCIVTMLLTITGLAFTKD